MSKEKLKIDCVVIGGGVIGLWTSLLIKRKKPEWEVVLLEKNQFLGDETTGRNSGVLHSGLYYPTNSEKHLTCLAGYNQWIEFCGQQKIPFKLCGKYIIASSDNDLSGLERYFFQGVNNGVKLVRSDQKEIRSLNEILNVKEAFFVPASGILDVPTAIKCLKHLNENLGVIILNSHSLAEIESSGSEQGHLLTTKSPSGDILIDANNLINCAGLQSVNLRKKLGLNDLENYWVKGNYLKTSQKLNYKHLYYPVPPQDLKGLGIHSTIDMESQVKFGPNTEEVPSCEVPNYALNPTQFKPMFRGVNDMFKNIDPDKIYLDYCGIRPKIKQAKNNEVYSDFIINGPGDTGRPNYFEALGIESPGVTAAPAIASKLANLIF